MGIAVSYHKFSSTRWFMIYENGRFRFLFIDSNPSSGRDMVIMKCDSPSVIQAKWQRLLQSYQYDILMLLSATYMCCNELVEEFGKGRSNLLNRLEDKYNCLRGLAQIYVGSDPLSTLFSRILLKNATFMFRKKKQKYKNNKSYIWSLECIEGNIS